MTSAIMPDFALAPGSTPAVKITVTLTHSRVSDLIIAVYAPEGSFWILKWLGGGGGSGVDMTGTRFYSWECAEAGSSVLMLYENDSAAPFNQTNYRFDHEEILGSSPPAVPSDKANLIGTWTLLLFDFKPGVEGQLIQWSLEVFAPATGNKTTVGLTAVGPAHQ